MKAKYFVIVGIVLILGFLVFTGLNSYSQKFSSPMGIVSISITPFFNFFNPIQQTVFITNENVTLGDIVELRDDITYVTGKPSKIYHSIIYSESQIDFKNLESMPYILKNQVAQIDVTDLVRSINGNWGNVITTNFVPTKAGHYTIVSWFLYSTNTSSSYIIFIPYNQVTVNDNPAVPVTPTQPFDTGTTDLTPTATENITEVSGGFAEITKPIDLVTSKGEKINVIQLIIWSILLIILFLVIVIVYKLVKRK